MFLAEKTVKNYVSALLTTAAGMQLAALVAALAARLQADRRD